MTENEIRINETTMWREWITVRGLEPITLQDIDDRLAELKQQVKVEPEVKVNFAERIIEEEIEKLEKLANEYNEDMDTEGYINNLNDSNILHRVLIRIKSESKISA